MFKTEISNNTKVTDNDNIIDNSENGNKRIRDSNKSVNQLKIIKRTFFFYETANVIHFPPQMKRKISTEQKNKESKTWQQRITAGYSCGK